MDLLLTIGYYEFLVYLCNLVVITEEPEEVHEM